MPVVLASVNKNAFSKHKLGGKDILWKENVRALAFRTNQTCTAGYVAPVCTLCTTLA